MGERPEWKPKEKAEVPAQVLGSGDRGLHSGAGSRSGFSTDGGRIGRPAGGVGVRTEFLTMTSRLLTITTKSRRVPFYQDREDRRSASCQKNTNYPFCAFALD